MRLNKYKPAGEAVIFDVMSVDCGRHVGQGASKKREGMRKSREKERKRERECEIIFEKELLLAKKDPKRQQ